MVLPYYCNTHSMNTQKIPVHFKPVVIYCKLLTMQVLEKSRIIYVLKRFYCDPFLSQRSHCPQTVQVYYGQILSTTSILIFSYTLWFHARYENIMKNVSASSRHEMLETRHFTHSEIWAFPRPSEQIFLINRPLRAPRKLS